MRREPPRRARPLVLLDTNALFLPFRTGLALVDEIERLLPGAELLVPTSVLAEVDRLVGRGVPHAPAVADLAAGFGSVPSQGRGDAAVLATALALGAWVLTADRLLAERLRRHGVGVLVPRDRARLHLLRGARVADLFPDPAPRARGKG